MYLLKKAIQLRENSHPDHEKPFLEHLEDLRTMVTRVVVTLLVSMIACFAFNKDLMQFFRRPVDQVLTAQIRKTLPTDAPQPLTVALWSEARKIEQAATSLTLPQREIFYQALADETLVFHAQSVSLYRATRLLPESKQGAFIDSLAASEQTKLQLRALLRTRPNSESDLAGNLKMMSALKPTEGFMLSMKLSFVAGIVLAFPLLLLFVLQFVLPGLHQHEKRVLWPAMSVGFGLFLAGASFAYYLVLPRALLFFAEWSGGMGISNDWRIGEYISFATQFTLLFGASFELPVVVMVFVKLGLLSYETMSRTRSYAIVAIFVAAAVLTPTPDILTMALMAAPMIILYEICIWLAYLDRNRARLKQEQEARESMERLLRREEKRQAQEAAEEAKWNEAAEPEDTHDRASGDDGWHAEYPQQDYHASDDLPPTIPEDEERRRMGP
jgi:sec-independent protein translocase protein TatC